MANLKIIIAGDPGVGKSRIYRSLFSLPLPELNQYYPSQEPEIGPLILGDIQLDVWDLPGSLDSNSAVNYLRDVRGAVLVFDVSRSETFANISGWIELVWSQNPGCPIIIVANKLDLASVTSDSRQTLEHAERLANSINARTHYYCKLVQVTATKPKNAFRIFSELFVAIQTVHHQQSARHSPLPDLQSQPIGQLIDQARRESTPPPPPPSQEAVVQEYKQSHPDVEVLPGFDRMVDRISHQPSDTTATIQKVTYFLKNSKAIRKAFSYLPEHMVNQAVGIAHSDPNWLVEQNLFYLFVYKGLEYLYLSTSEYSAEQVEYWAKRVADLLITDLPTWDRFTDLSKETAMELVRKFANHPGFLEPDGGWDMEIYSTYRDEVYTS